MILFIHEILVVLQCCCCCDLGAFCPLLLPFWWYSAIWSFINNLSMSLFWHYILANYLANTLFGVINMDGFFGVLVGVFSKCDILIWCYCNFWPNANPYYSHCSDCVIISWCYCNLPLLLLGVFFWSMCKDADSPANKR